MVDEQDVAEELIRELFVTDAPERVGIEEVRRVELEPVVHLRAPSGRYR
jgi:hypothetical protein